MRAIGKYACGIAAFLMLTGFCSSAVAHMAFRKQLQKKYPGMKVNCNACHAKGKPKTERNEFGKLFAKELKAINPTLTKDWKSKKGVEKKKFEKSTMVPAFDKALVKVKALKNDKKEVYDELIKNGKIPEIKKDPKYKPEQGTTAESGDKQESTETNDKSGEKDSSDESKQTTKAESDSKTKNG